ncbi:Acg family FMN-binding oxidoreductase [Shewanella sp. A14]
MNRRNFLKITGSAAIVTAASVTCGLYILGKGPAANLPWHIAGSQYNEPRMRALSWAILAPNPHNRQPWLIEMHDELSMTLSLDLNKLLPHTDPFNRQILIGLGCFCELLSQAASHDNYRVEFDWFPQGVNNENQQLDEKPIANIHFFKGATPDPLFKHVLNRRSYKHVFDENKDIEANVLNELGSAQVDGAKIHSNHCQTFIAKMRKETMQAMAIEMQTKRVYQESAKLMRIGTDEIKAQPDGIALDGHLMIALRHMGIVTHENLMDMTSSTYQQGIQDVISTLSSTKGYMWITTKDNNRKSQIDAGRNYIRANLAATALGLRMHPVSQGLQEYAEMQNTYENIHDIVGTTSSERVQMLTRLGYGEDIKASPRWPIEQCIIS